VYVFALVCAYNAHVAGAAAAGACPNLKNTATPASTSFFHKEIMKYN
jgi:hypothetical protein